MKFSFRFMERIIDTIGTLISLQINLNIAQEFVVQEELHQIYSAGGVKPDFPEIRCHDFCIIMSLY